MQKFSTLLKQTIAQEWNKILNTNSAVSLVQSGDYDIRFYQIYLIETYHYTSHNAKNQALVGARIDNKNTHYMKFCFKHAWEEAGHELMAFHDLKKTGLDIVIEDLPKPLPETQLFIDELYKTSREKHLFSRLGYSAWAEDSYIYFMPFLKMLSEKLNLQKHQMTFFIEHAELDDGHSQHVFDTINSLVRSSDEYLAVEETTITTLNLMSNILNAVTREYQNIKVNNDSQYKNLLG